MSDEKKPDPPPLDAERARLRALGHTDEEISKIVVERALRGGGPPVQQQGVFSNVLASIVAVTSYVSGLFTSIPSDIARILDRSVPVPARGGAFAAVVIKAVVIGVLAFAGWQEWQHYIISAPKTAIITVDLTAAQATKAKEEAKVAAEVAAGQAAQAKKAEEDAKVAAEVARGNAADARIKEANAEYAEQLAKGQKAKACSDRMTMIANTLSPGADQDLAITQYNKDCNPRYEGCAKEFKVYIDALREAEYNTTDTKEEKAIKYVMLTVRLEAYRAKCGWHEEERDAALAATNPNGTLGVMQRTLADASRLKPTPQPQKTTTAKEPEPSPTPTPSYSALATPEPSPTPTALRTPTNFDCANGKRMGADYVICASPKLLDVEARLEDAYKDTRARWPNSADDIQKSQFDWIKSYGPDCGLRLPPKNVSQGYAAWAMFRASQFFS